MPRNSTDTRTRILDAALALLEDGATDEVRMSDIAARAGVSRQAVYLHFGTRAELLIAAVRRVDELERIDERFAASRAVRSGPERLDAFVDAWGSYIPEIHGTARALRAMRDSDEAAAAAWEERMRVVRHECKVAVDALRAEGLLSPTYPSKQATDLLWTLLSVHNWEQLVVDCGWSQKRYLETLKATARAVLVVPEAV